MPKVPPPELDPKRRSAPRVSRRGTYDRHLSPSERVRAQRAELLHAVRQVLGRGEVPTVANVTAARGLGRNTFYEHFQAVDLAVHACSEECAAVLKETVMTRLGVASVATPSERARELALALTEFRSTERERWMVLRNHGLGGLEAVLRGALATLHDFYVAAGASRAAWSSLSSAAATGAVLGVLFEADARTYEQHEVVEELVAVIGRHLR